MTPSRKGLRRPIRPQGQGAAAAVGTVMLVVITVATVIVVGMFLFGIVDFPEDPPEVDVNYTKLNDRWTAHVTGLSDPVELSDLRLLARSDGEVVVFDTDGDSVPDTPLIFDMDALAVPMADGPQHSPAVLVDADGNGQLSVGDSIVAYTPYYYPVGPLMDADRAYSYVGNSPDAIPSTSTMLVMANPETLGSSDIDPGDQVLVEIHQGGAGGPVMTSFQGPASIGGMFWEKIEVEAGWGTGSFTAVFTIRPGEGDEWSHSKSFKIGVPVPITPQERAAYDNTTEPLAFGDVISIVHKPTNSVVLEFLL